MYNLKTISKTFYLKREKNGKIIIYADLKDKQVLSLFSKRKMKIYA